MADKPNFEEPFTNPNRKRVLGLDKQEWIKYFFSGNASLAIFILILICAFLLREAGGFFPEHHAGLKLYRRSGVETYTIIDSAYQKYKALATHLSIAFGAEYNEPGAELGEKLTAYRVLEDSVKHETTREQYSLKDAKSKAEQFATSDPQKAAKYEALVTRIEEQIIAERDELISDLDNFSIAKMLGKHPVAELAQLSEEDQKMIVAAVSGKNPTSRTAPDAIKAIEAEKAPIDNAAWESNKYINDLYLRLTNTDAKPLDKLWREFQKVTTTNRNNAESVISLPKRIEAQINVGLTNERLVNEAGEDADPEKLAKWNALRADKYGRAIEEVARATYFEPLARVFYFQRLKSVLDTIPDGEGEATDNGPAMVGVSKIEDADQKIIFGWLEAAETNYPQLWNAMVAGNSVRESVEALPADAQLLGYALKDLPVESLERLIALSEIPTNEDDGYIKSLQAMARTPEVFVEDYPFDEKIQFVYDNVPRVNAAFEEMKTKLAQAKAELPKELSTELGNEELARFNEDYDLVISELTATQKDLVDWRHDNEYGFGASLMEFFFGTKWTNNSSIQDRYGLLPLFTGSIIISIIAIVIAVPFAISAAIYVNQLASHRAQTFLKPAIEFIEAIPSIVLGFLGIVVVSQFLLEISEISWLQWLPGFPIDSRLNMLAAGLLLAFMAVPTIFTLAEDALNNVPDYYRQASLALGATRLTTAVRVMIPAAFSGIIAAVLLGFGRVIGETMVVLLVAGNRISMPSFGDKGLGVVTEPSHTMTGMIAQGLGEAVVGSTTWRALFMVGFVLFMISLVVNFFAQRVMHSFAKKNS